MDDSKTMDYERKTLDRITDQDGHSFVMNDLAFSSPN